MSLIDSTYFQADLTIAQVDQQEVAAVLQVFIDQCEPKLLTDLFGYEFYTLYTAGIATDQIYKDIRDGKEYTNRLGQLVKWKGLKFTDGTAKKSLIANYVYYWYMRDQVTATTGTGEVAAQNQNAISASSWDKQNRAYNEFVNMAWELVEFLLSNQAIYPKFVSPQYRLGHEGKAVNRLLNRKNSLNL